MKKIIFLFLAFISLNVMAQEEEPVYKIVTKMASFPGGQEKMMKFIQDNKQMPAAAKEAGVTGRVIVDFIVEKDGSLSNIKVLRGIGKGCDEEAIRLIQSMPKWEPGENSGKVVRTSFMLPINF